MIPTNIIIHHSLTKDSETVSWGAIRKYHMSWKYKGEAISEAYAQQLISQGIQGVEKPWKDIGYHFGIELVGDYYETLAGREMTEAGAHCPGMNEKSLGICVIGNFDLNSVPEAQMTVLIKVVRSLQVIFKITRDRVAQHHKYASYKSCPGTQFQWGDFISRINA